MRAAAQAPAVECVCVWGGGGGGGGRRRWSGVTGNGGMGGGGERIYQKKKGHRKYTHNTVRK